ncbi:MAG: serine/threonine protein kinase [bacterium]|nr:serine/threonine protein kinase [bacterium]
MSIDIPNYRILGKLGTGANSTLLLARSMQTGARYAVKVVKVRQPEDMKFIDQLRDEHAVGSAMDHPIIRKTFELRLIRRRLTKIKSGILFMEYVDGIPLNDPEFSCPLTKLLGYFRIAAQGLLAMHRAGYVHADLKPGNILITPDERVKLIDLGQSCAIRTSKPRIQGTIDYMAPEQAALKPLDARTDVFGLGATLFKVLTGQPMSTDMNQNISLHSLGLLGKRATELQKRLEVELAAPLERLIEECCAKDPMRRPSNMKVLIDRLDMVRTILQKRALEEAQAAQPPVAQSAPATLPAPRPHPPEGADPQI